MNAYICPTVRRAVYEAEQLQRSAGGVFRYSNLRLEQADGTVTLFVPVSRAARVLLGVELDDIKLIDPASWAREDRDAAMEIVNVARARLRARRRKGAIDEA